MSFARAVARFALPASASISGPELAISALINPYGVSIHPIRRDWIGMSVKAYLHVQWGQ